ncbi:hypothetical protein LWI28_015192 [Acer negundo]|uniref:Uncharacterized protein n=1 Tax=Acer negundo TaxID=4023 RepID=A0AAD5J9P7_ACENE|nr:hypothetical protein LWI28_015192 [Acer negundo]
MPNFTAFGASYVEDHEDEGKKALNVNSIYECQMLLLNVLKKNKELSKENELLKMWKISSVEKIRALEECKQICQVKLHQSREMISWIQINKLQIFRSLSLASHSIVRSLSSSFSAPFLRLFPHQSIEESVVVII